jgi:hypothetical protein
MNKHSGIFQAVGSGISDGKYFITEDTKNEGHILFHTCDKNSSEIKFHHVYYIGRFVLLPEWQASVQTYLYKVCTGDAIRMFRNNFEMPIIGQEVTDLIMLNHPT